MTGADLKRIRRELGLTVIQLGRALGYQGNDNTVSVQIRNYERGARPIPPWIGRLIQMFGWHGVPRKWII